MKIRIYTLFIISFLTISCKSEVAREKRPQGKIIFRGLTYFNPTLAIGSYRKTGSTSGGSGVDTTSKGFVDIFKDKIIIEYQKSSIPEFNGKRVELNINNCILGKNNDYGQDYHYDCGNSEFEVTVGADGSLKSAQIKEGDDKLGFIPISAFKK